jgi:hypothetical protein
MRRGLDLVGADAPRRDRAARLHAGVAKPRPLRRRIGLGAQPNVELAGLGIEAFHRFARIHARLCGRGAGGRRVGGLRVRYGH